MDTKNLFNAYVAIAGGRKVASDRLGVSLAMVGHLATGFRKVSPQLANKIHADTNGTIAREAMRPDIFGPAAKPEGVADAA